MKKRMKMMIVSVLFGAMLAGCSGNNTPDEVVQSADFNQTGFPIVNEPISLKMMGPKGALNGPWADMAFFKEMESLTNIRFQFDTPPAESFDEKKNLAFASSTLPDVFFASRLSSADEVNYGSQGVLIPLEDLIAAHAPNIQKMLDEHPDIKKSITTTDGHIYALPQYTELAHNLINKAWINGDWLAHTGNGAPKTVEELQALLQAFRDGDPNGNGEADEIPLSAPTIGALRPFMLAAFGHVTNGVEVDGDKVRFVPVTEGYKAYLTFMQGLYAEKLLDSEIFSHTVQQYTAKGKSDRFGVFSAAAPFTVLDIQQDEDNFKHPVLPAMTSSESTSPVYPLNNGIQRGAFAITNVNPNPEATMRWIDYLYTEEGGALANSGKEGEGWKWLDDGKTTWDRISAEGKNAEETRGQHTPDPGNTLPTFKSKAFHYKINSPVTQWLHEVSEDYLAIAKRGYPSVYFTNEEQSLLNAITADVTTYVEQMEAKFIVGGMDDKAWDDYVATIEQMRLQELLDIHQAAYDRWKSAE